MRRNLFLLFMASVLWIPALHLWFRPGDPRELAPALAERQRMLALSDESPERALLRRNNPEWDLMNRTFSVLSFANLALKEPTQKAEHLAVIDAVLARTLRDERNADDEFLLPYVHRAPFRDVRGRSLFVDGEIALMLAARQLVEPREDLASLLRERIDTIAGQLERAPVLAAESYPDEGWTFCNTVALAALRLSDAVDGRDHSELRRRWVESARKHLVDAHTGLLVSSFTFKGVTRDGPEGSTLWLTAHMLQVVDEDFAREQYQRARQELIGEALGFAWAAEWPVAAPNVDDIDSGPTIPLVNANAGSSGLAFVGAAAFDDEPLLEGLTTSLRFAAFPVTDDTGLRFAAGNPLADAVLLYSLVEGPLWRRAMEPRTMEARR
ncbi:linalool dehydratase/isomerase domain-containing protein [Archangium lansingense]|uniref:Linalool dehydratase/isomerase domain-containing protein n=1 Tax=Archangium lansingense TaxID=2995310 RepID=A0ABT4AKZ5_9BACT|nr:hypothetical protein [Archangium lansinium]MCY1082315.1 hypothetical protein [Archangium lansinium]